MRTAVQPREKSRLLKRNACGFALMDVMAAVVILGLFIMPLLIARNNTILVAAEAVSLRRARLLAEQKMGSIEIDPETGPQAGEGDFGEENPGFSWSIETETKPFRDMLPKDKKEGEEEDGGDEAGDESGDGTGEEEEEDTRTVTVLTLRVRYPSPYAEGDGGMQGAPPPASEDGEGPAFKPGEVVLVRAFVNRPPEDELGGGEEEPEQEPGTVRKLLDLFGPAPQAGEQQQNPRQGGNPGGGQNENAGGGGEGGE